MSQEYTNKVVTLWYRPPELLLGETRYDESIDLWSAGCILAELLLGKALFPGKDETDQLKLIFETMGTPDSITWNRCFRQLPKLSSGDVRIKKSIASKFREKYVNGDDGLQQAFNLIERLLQHDPKKRVRALYAMESIYFRSHPIAPDNPLDMIYDRSKPSIDNAMSIQGTNTFPKKMKTLDEILGGDSHEYQTKPIRREAKAAAQKASSAAKKNGLDDKAAYEDAYAEYLRMAAINRSGTNQSSHNHRCQENEIQKLQQKQQWGELREEQKREMHHRYIQRKKERSRRHGEELLAVTHIDGNRKDMIKEKGSNEIGQEDGEKKGLNSLKVVETACDRDSGDENINNSCINDEKSRVRSSVDSEREKIKSLSRTNRRWESKIIDSEKDLRHNKYENISISSARPHEKDAQDWNVDSKHRKDGEWKTLDTKLQRL